MSQNVVATILENIDAGNLSDAALDELVNYLLNEESSPADKAVLLDRWHVRGETANEIAYLAKRFRDLARDPEVGTFSSAAIDVCGTGGDGAGTFNISTVVSFIVAAAGVPMMKHGNRSITSKSGSADFLEAIGVSLAIDLPLHEKALHEVGYTFFFAPEFHPAFKAIMPVRKELAAQGKRSVFNILGPLLNPGRPQHQVLGVFSPVWMERLANTLHEIGLKAGWVVCGEYQKNHYVDELTCAGINHAVGFGEFAGRTETWDAESLGLQSGTIEELKGGEVADNLNTFEEILSGQANPVLVDSILLNAGLALWTAGKSSTLKEGIQLARETLSSSVMIEWIQKLKEFYQS